MSISDLKGIVEAEIQRLDDLINLDRNVLCEKGGRGREIRDTNKQVGRRKGRARVAAYALCQRHWC